VFKCCIHCCVWSCRLESRAVFELRWLSRVSRLLCDPNRRSRWIRSRSLGRCVIFWAARNCDCSTTLPDPDRSWIEWSTWLFASACLWSTEAQSRTCCLTPCTSGSTCVGSSLNDKARLCLHALLPPPSQLYCPSAGFEDSICPEYCPTHPLPILLSTQSISFTWKFLLSSYYPDSTLQDHAKYLYPITLCKSYHYSKSFEK
jgi:hypothetical protein